MVTAKKKGAKKKGATKKKAKPKAKATATPAQKKARDQNTRAYRWKPGQSGNPKGRPVGNVSLAKTMRDQLNERASLVPAIRAKAERLGLDPMRTTIGAVLVLSMIYDAALEGNATVAKEIMQRIDGIVVDPAKPNVDDNAHERLPLPELEEKVLRALKRRGK